MKIINLKTENHVHIQKELAERDERLRRAQEEIESLKQTIRELQSEVADDRICNC